MSASPSATGMRPSAALQPGHAPRPAGGACAAPWTETRADRALALIRRSIPSAEFRHHSLPWLAEAVTTFLPGWTPPPGAARRVDFGDGAHSLTLSSPLILAAGANKDGRHIAAYATLGFGAICVGTATLRPRKGNPLMPRVRTVEGVGAIQNAMGLNNPGIDVLVRRIEEARDDAAHTGLAIGLSIAEDPDLLPGETGPENALACLERALDHADFIELNLSCPNTGHDRHDQKWDNVARLLGEAAELRARRARRIPILVKLSPDLDEPALGSALQSIVQAGLSGAVLFNTWPAARGSWPDGSALPELPEVGRPGLRGGLSGRPLFGRTREGLRRARALNPGLALFACGGVETGAQLGELLVEGASAVEIYSVLAFRWMAGRRILEEAFPEAGSARSGE